jgi:hypothetical protein
VSNKEEERMLIRRLAHVSAFSTAVFVIMAMITSCSVLTPPPTPTPLPTATPLPPPTRVPSPTPPFALQEQSDLVQWCTTFREIYYGTDAIRAEINDWLDSQGTEVTDIDIQNAQDFSHRFEELYLRMDELERLPPVREIDDLLSDALFSEMKAYDELHTNYVMLDPSYYDSYVEDKREAERLGGPIIDKMNDTMLEYHINPTDCTPYQ